jgi:hypothetical protein
LTYLFRVLGQSVVHLDGFLDHVLIWDLEQSEADNLRHFDGGLFFSWLGEVGLIDVCIVKLTV